MALEHALWGALSPLPYSLCFLVPEVSDPEQVWGVAYLAGSIPGIAT